jgi:hypothetical protein
MRCVWKSPRPPIVVSNRRRRQQESTHRGLLTPRSTTHLADNGKFIQRQLYGLYAFHPIDDLVKYLRTHRESERKFLDTTLGLVGLAQGRNPPCSRSLVKSPSYPCAGMPEDGERRQLSQCAARPASRTIASRLRSLRDRTVSTGSRLDIKMEIDRW